MLSNSRLGRLGFDPFTMTTAGVGAASAVFDVVGGIIGAKGKEKAFREATAKQKIALDIQEEQRQEQLAAARKQQTMMFAMEESAKRRQSQAMTLWIVGGIAVVIAGGLIYAASKKRTGVKK